MEYHRRSPSAADYSRYYFEAVALSAAGLAAGLIG